MGIFISILYYTLILHLKILDNNNLTLYLLLIFKGFAPPGSRNRYRLHVIGSHHDAPTLYGKGSHELVLMTYDSRADAWIFGSVVGRCRFSKLAGKTSMASIPEGFLLGGQEETDEVVMVKIEEDHEPKKKKNAYKVYVRV